MISQNLCKTKLIETWLSPKHFVGIISGKTLKTFTKSGSTVDLAYATYENTDAADNPATPLVILHGLLGSKNNWNSLSKAILEETGRKVIGVDARNHGDSPHSPIHTYPHMVADVVELLRKLDIGKVNVVGHSMGGRTAMALALLHPEIISTLTVVDISPITTSPQIYSMMGLFDAMNAVQITPGVPISKARKMADEQLKVALSDVSVRNFVITNLVQTNNGAYKWRVNLPVLKEYFQNHIATFPSNLKGLQYGGPTLLLAGADSDYVRAAELPGIREYFPKAQLTFVKDAGHWVHSQKPDVFLTHLFKFLKES